MIVKLFKGVSAGLFEQVKIYESPRLGSGKNSSAIALPGIGIIVGDGVYSKQLDLPTVKHEFGHFLQFRKTGFIKFYILVGLPSLLSAWLNWHGKGHNHYWTELWCNHLASNYFSDESWNIDRFPSRDLSKISKFWLLKWRF